jgi:hypothetical protein
MFVPAMAGVSHGFWKGSARELEARRLTDFGGGQRRRARRSGVSLARLLIGSLLCARVTGARCGPSREPLRGELRSPLTGLSRRFWDGYKRVG